MGEIDPELVVITAGMPDGTSTDVFQKAFPERFFDVGIAEAHGVTAAAGMATQEGITPVVCIYSTFLQRAFDSIVHDVALQKLPVVFCMDRAGIAGPDGPTLHGSFDIAYMMLVPHMTVTAPKDGVEMLSLVRIGTKWKDGPFSIRWPREAVPKEVPGISEVPDIDYGTWETLKNGCDLAFLAVGTMVGVALEAADVLEEKGIRATVVNCRFLKPYDKEILLDVIQKHDKIIFLEEGTVVNGFGAFMAREIGDLEEDFFGEVKCLGLPDRFIEHGPRDTLLKELGLDGEGVAREALKMVQSKS